MCYVQGVGGELAKGETAAQRFGWYKEVYSIIEQQLQAKRCCSLSSRSHQAHVSESIHYVKCSAAQDKTES